MAAPAPMFAQEEEPKPKILFTNVNVFDGKNEKLIKNANVLVEGNLIKTVSTGTIEPKGATNVIDGGGRTLMPGLIDAHYHVMWATIPLAEVVIQPEGYINLVAAKNADQLLLQGFTTVRDVGDNSFSLKHAIDKGIYPGPRIYPSGAMIS